MPVPFSIHFVVLTSLMSGLFSDGASLSTTLSDVELIRSAVKAHRLITGSLPDAQIGLRELVERPDTLAPEKEWLKAFNAVPLDPWGREYQYVAGTGYPGGFGIYSTGPNGVSKTQGNDPDDSNSWSENGRAIRDGTGRLWVQITLMAAVSCLLGFICGVVLIRFRSKRVDYASQ